MLLFLFFKIGGNGILAFEELNNTDYLEQPSSLPLIATLWIPANQQNSTLYSRVTKDNSTLELLREFLTEETNFQPELAVVATWISNISVRCSDCCQGYVCTIIIAMLDQRQRVY